MSAIRPDLPVAMTTPSSPARAAQAAFFRAALGDAQAASADPIPRQAVAAEPRLARPGQLLDIRV